MARKWLFAIIALAVVCSATIAAPPITKTEARSLPPDVVIKRVLEQFGDILVPPEPWPKGHKAKLPLFDLHYATRARATYLPGLCEADHLVFDFDPVKPDDLGPDTPVRVSGIAADRTFHFMVPPSVDGTRQELSWADRRALDNRCAALKSDQMFFFAADPDKARDGILLLLAAKQEAMRSPAVFGCRDYVGWKCGDALAAFTPDNIHRIEQCEDPMPDRHAYCMAIWGLDSMMKVYSERTGDRSKILQVQFDAVVTTGDMRAD